MRDRGIFMVTLIVYVKSTICKKFIFLFEIFATLQDAAWSYNYFSGWNDRRHLVRLYLCKCLRASYASTKVTSTFVVLRKEIFVYICVHSFTSERRCRALSFKTRSFFTWDDCEYKWPLYSFYSDHVFFCADYITVVTCLRCFCCLAESFLYMPHTWTRTQSLYVFIVNLIENVAIQNYYTHECL